MHSSRKYIQASKQYYMNIHWRLSRPWLNANDVNFARHCTFSRIPSYNVQLYTQELRVRWITWLIQCVWLLRTIIRVLILILCFSFFLFIHTFLLLSYSFLSTMTVAPYASLLFSMTAIFLMIFFSWDELVKQVYIIFIIVRLFILFFSYTIVDGVKDVNQRLLLLRLYSRVIYSEEVCIYHGLIVLH